VYHHFAQHLGLGVNLQQGILQPLASTTKAPHRIDHNDSFRRTDVIPGECELTQRFDLHALDVAGAIESRRYLDRFEYYARATPD
jgi:hypothetical protein